MSLKPSIKVSENRPDNEKAKRIWRNAIDSTKKLDDMVKTRKAYRDVFLPEAISLRNKVQDAAERLMFYDASEFGRKCEELLWRKVYYDVIQLMKHNKKSMRPNSSLESAFRTHLYAAAGFYHHLLIRLQSEFQLDLSGIVDFHHIPHSTISGKQQQRRLEPVLKATVWAKRACHRCLVYLGDIARYQQDYDTVQSGALSQRYYHQALALIPEVGMPHNQLGTLAGSRYYNMDAAYYYMRCMLCPQTFEGAKGNLKRLFEKNSRRFQEIGEKSPRDLPPDQQRAKDIRRFIVRFMHLMEVFMMAEGGSCDLQQLQSCCQSTLADFNLVMFYSPNAASSVSRIRSDLVYLENDIILKIVSMCMMSMYNLQKAGNRVVTAAIAFSLALFSHVLNHAVSRVQSAVYDLENPPKLQEEPEEDDVEGKKESPERTLDEEIDGTRRKTPEVLKKRQKASLQRRRRRRRRGSGSGGDSEDLSEGEINASDDEREALNYLRGSSSSDSDNDDSLMVSQELRPGFSAESEGDLEGTLAKLSGLVSLSSSFSGTSLHEAQPLDLPDTVPADFKPDLFLDSSSFLQGTAQFAQWIHQPPDERRNDFNDVVGGKKHVPVPPGNMPTDTDNSSLLTESDGDSDTEEDSEDSVLDKNEWENRRVERLLEVVAKEELLMSVKVFCDWMDCHPHIMATCAQSGGSLWVRLSLLLNLLPHEQSLFTTDLCGRVIKKCCEYMTSQDWCQRIRLPEDLHLSSFPPLRARQASFDTTFRTQLTLEEEAALRVLCLRRYGYCVSKVAAINFGYDAEKNMFIGPKVTLQQNDVSAVNSSDKTTEQKKMADAETRRNQLMRDMAQLRLQSEVAELQNGSKEKSALTAAANGTLPPYLVPDASALCDSLVQMKQLTSSARFILIIPTAVIDHLDALKKDSALARDAIRWLEVEFGRGNRYIRAQKGHERADKMPLRNLKKKDKESWRLIQSIDCAKYFSQQGDGYKQTGMVCFVTNMTQSHFNSNLRTKESLTAAQADGILVQDVATLHRQWREASK